MTKGKLVLVDRDTFMGADSAALPLMEPDQIAEIVLAKGHIGMTVGEGMRIKVKNLDRDTALFLQAVYFGTVVSRHQDIVYEWDSGTKGCLKLMKDIEPWCQFKLVRREAQATEWYLRAERYKDPDLMRKKRAVALGLAENPYLGLDDETELVGD